MEFFVRSSLSFVAIESIVTPRFVLEDFELFVLERVAQYTSSNPDLFAPCQSMTVLMKNGNKIQIELRH